MSKPTRQKYTFRSNSGAVITIAADSELKARKLAMTELHGQAPQFIGRPPSLIGKDGWTGGGLRLQSMDHQEEEQCHAIQS